MPAAARKSDPGVTHCSGFVIAEGSSDVYTNNQPAARVGHASTAHNQPGGRRCASHVSTIARGSSTVFINGFAAARVNDPFSGCTSVAQGSPDVVIG